MKEFIKIQYRLYLADAANIGIDKINKLAEKFMTEAEAKALFTKEV